MHRICTPKYICTSTSVEIIHIIHKVDNIYMRHQKTYIKHFFNGFILNGYIFRLTISRTGMFLLSSGP